MQKGGFGIILILIAAILGFSLFGCSADTGNNGGGYNYEDEPVDYYGCPNSKRIKKLNLLKKKAK